MGNAKGGFVILTRMRMPTPPAGPVWGTLCGCAARMGLVLDYPVEAEGKKEGAIDTFPKFHKAS